MLTVTSDGSVALLPEKDIARHAVAESWPKVRFDWCNASETGVVEKTVWSGAPLSERLGRRHRVRRARYLRFELAEL